jgi:ATP/maltotriose-dependent transcriptional regulator MalT
MLGPAPPAEMRRWIAANEPHTDSPLVAYGVGRASARLAHMEYRLDEAREHLAAADEALRELGFAILLTASGQNWSLIALAAGDVAEAARLLRRSYEEGLRLGDHSYHSTTTAMLADAVRRLGDMGEAESLALAAEAETAPADVITFAWTRATRALIAVGRDEPEAALALARDAVRYAELTDFPVAQAEALLAEGAVLRAAGRAAEARATFARAEALAAAKGDLPVRDRIRAAAGGGAV